MPNFKVRHSRSALLQGASLDDAQLQGASLYVAHLEGASLEQADLEGARLDWAFLEGASLFLAALHGTTLNNSNLLGASFEKADLVAVDMSASFLWRSGWDETTAHSLWTANATWEPRALSFAPSGPSEMLYGHFGAWNDASYAQLKKDIESIPEGEHRTLALQRIAQLDCSIPNLTPCSQATPVPNAFASAVELSENTYLKVLATALDKLVCDDPMKDHPGLIPITPPEFVRI